MTFEAPEPERPAGIPPGASWNGALGKWELCARDGEGAREGESVLFRPDGRLYARVQLRGGREEGPFVVFHPDGRVAREGSHRGGRVDGRVTAYASDDPGGEPLRACCVPPSAARLEARYRDGDLLIEVFYDGEGRPILSDGRPWPARPPGVPASAELDEATGAWALRTPVLERLWTGEGRVAEEIELADGRKRVTRVFGADGALVEETCFAPDGRRDGPFLRRLGGDALGSYADGRIRAVRGAYAGDQVVGTWTFLDGEGLTVRTVEHGAALSDDGIAASPAFGDGSRDVSHWSALSAALLGQGRIREALCAAARAAARGEPDTGRAALLALLARFAAPVSLERQTEWGAALARATDLTPARALDALVGGADPAASLRALAAVLPGISDAAADLVEASLLLAPDRRMTHLTRALIRFQRGDQAGALADAARVDEESPGAADSLRDYVRVAFRPFAFVPSIEPLAPDPELAHVEAAIAQELPAIRRAMAVYATRLSTLRARAAGAAATAIPDVGALLDGAAADLRREQVAFTDEDGSETVVTIDETAGLAPAGAPALLAQAHADWAALAWLCWAVGLDAVAQPAVVRPRPALATAMRLAVTRAWRLRDQLTTGGLLARTNGVPGFEWQGQDVDALPAHLAEMAAQEYVAVRAMFLWLASPDASSPFQDDLQDA